MTWQPWIDFAQDQEVLPIPEPPCARCKHWRPVRHFDEYGNFEGVILCHARDQSRDFSCFREREEKEKGA